MLEYCQLDPKATFTHARSGCGAEAGGFWYSRSATTGMFTHTWSGRGRICHFLRTMMVWSARFRSGRGKLGVGPISCGTVFAAAPPPLRDCACVNACNDLCWSQFSARPRPRRCERTFRNNLHWNFNQDTYIFIQKNAFESIVCELAAILSLPQCVNG